MDYIALNEKACDKRAQLHVRSQFYDVAGFLAGSPRLTPWNRIRCLGQKVPVVHAIKGREPA